MYFVLFSRVQFVCIRFNLEDFRVCVQCLVNDLNFSCFSESTHSHGYRISFLNAHVLTSSSFSCNLISPLVMAFHLH